MSGDYVACLGVSEVGAGSDVAGLTTTARVDGDDYIINGSKMWTTNGTQADWCCLLVNTDDEGGRPPHGNKTMLCMPMDLPGISAAPRFDKLGMRSSDTTQLTLEDVRVPRANVIGQPNKGFVYQMIQFQEERLWAAANALKGLQKCIDDTLEYTQTRHAFGKPLIANQVVRFRLAELQTELECLRALTWKAAEMAVTGEDVTQLASMAKLKTGRLAREITDSCLQYWGGAAPAFQGREGGGRGREGERERGREGEAHTHTHTHRSRAANASRRRDPSNPASASLVASSTPRASEPPTRVRSRPCHDPVRVTQAWVTCRRPRSRVPGATCASSPLAEVQTRSCWRSSARVPASGPTRANEHRAPRRARQGSFAHRMACRLGTMDGLATHMLTNGFMDGLAVSAACVCGLAQLSCLKSGITCMYKRNSTQLKFRSTFEIACGPDHWARDLIGFRGAAPLR